MSTVEEILEAALTLPATERARLVRELADTLDDSENDDPEAEASWSEEIARRHAEVVSGSARLIERADWESQVKARYGWK